MLAVNQIMRNNGGFYIRFHSGNQYVTVIGRPPSSIVVEIPQIKDSTIVFFVIAFEKS